MLNPYFRHYNKHPNVWQEPKTEYISMCTTNKDYGIKTLSCTSLKQVDDYKYSRSYFHFSERFPYQEGYGLVCVKCYAQHLDLPN